MRRKKHLGERMEESKSAFLAVEGNDFYVSGGRDIKRIVDFKGVFGNDNPVHLELGCGKGQFIAEMAKKHSDVNFIAVEKLSNVVIVAAEKVEKLQLPNVKFLNISAENLSLFIPEKGVEVIYLNFSCPFPKKTYANRRLTNPKFLNVYRKLLNDKGEIYLKTDNKDFFDYSIESLIECGFILKNVCYDLHNSDYQGNVVTEYEQKFVDQGLPIYRLEAYIE